MTCCFFKGFMYCVMTWRKRLCRRLCCVSVSHFKCPSAFWVCCTFGHISVIPPQAVPQDLYAIHSYRLAVERIETVTPLSFRSFGGGNRAGSRSLSRSELNGSSQTDLRTVMFTYFRESAGMWFTHSAPVKTCALLRCML